MILNKAEKPGRVRYTQRVKDNIFSFVYLGPFLIIFFLFTVLPVLTSIGLSFTNFDMLQTPKIVGISNYLTLFLNDEEFILSIKNTLIIALFTGPIGYLASLIFAWFINELNPKLRAVMVLVFYAPSISGGAYMIWSLLFSSDAHGYVNSLIIYLGLSESPIEWFTNTKYMLPLVIIVMLWMSLGAGFLSFVAGLQGIDRTYYEVGYIEGIRNRWQELWFVTLPSMKPQLLFGAVMSITSSFGAGAVSTALCGFPSTDYAAHTMMNHLEDYGSQRFEMGQASAIATLLFLLMIGANTLVQKLLSNVGK